MERLRRNLRYLCDESRMLTGIAAAYGTVQNSESILHGRAQEFRMSVTVQSSPKYARLLKTHCLILLH